MQIVETTNEGLKRAYTLTIAATDIADRIEGEVARMAPQVRMPGFRPGKVPANLVRKMHGPALRQEALNTSIREGVDQLVAEHRLRPAMQPKVELEGEPADGKDIAVQVSLEVLPQIAAPALDGLKLERLVVPVTDAEVDAEVARFATQQKRFAAAPEDHVARTGDQLMVDFVGKRGDVAFAGGSAENQAIELGAGRLIPGFEEQLIGVKAGEQRRIALTFPGDYGAKELAGKDATFDITVHEVKVPAEAAIDDEFATQLGLESLDQLKGLLRGQLEQHLAGLTRTAMKRALLDQLAAAHDFEVPPSMVEAEFAQILAQLEQEARNEADSEAAIAEIEAEKDDYRAIAERRVRLGLLLSEIGQGNGVDVTSQEMQTLVGQAAQQYRPEDRERFAEYIRADAMAAAQLRAPLYEDKVVDFLIGKAEVSEREVTRDELQAAIEADEPGTQGHEHAHRHAHVHGPDCDHDQGHDHDADEAPVEVKAEAQAEPEPEPAKKPAARKAKAEKQAASADEQGVAEAKPARKPAAKQAPAKAEPVDE